jgi:hypothetical protein
MNKKLIELIREKFKARLAAKTGWGRNDIMEQFELALNEALLELMDG